MTGWDEVPERHTGFSLIFTAKQLLALGCLHDAGDGTWTPVPGCRPCSISQDIWDARDLGEMELRQSLDTLSGSRRYWGTVSGERGRRVLCRMIALAYGHPEPLDPEDRETARATIESYA